MNEKITNKNIDDCGDTSWDNENKNSDNVINEVNNHKYMNTAITDIPVAINPKTLNDTLG